VEEPGKRVEVDHGTSEKMCSPGLYVYDHGEILQFLLQRQEGQHRDFLRMRPLWLHRPPVS